MSAADDTLTLMAGAPAATAQPHDCIGQMCDECIAERRAAHERAHAVQTTDITALRARAEAAERERDALRAAVREYLDARHRGLVELLAYLDADPADAAARDAASACEARVTATRTRLAALVGGAS